MRHKAIQCDDYPCQPEQHPDHWETPKVFHRLVVGRWVSGWSTKDIEWQPVANLDLPDKSALASMAAPLLLSGVAAVRIDTFEVYEDGSIQQVFGDR